MQLPFSKSQLLIILEAARFSLGNSNRRRYIAENLDILDEEVGEVRDLLEKFMTDKSFREV